MKRLSSMNGRTLALIGVIVPLLALFVWVALRSGPLAPVPVSVITVENQSIAPALFGIGTVESRYTYKIGPTVAGRVLRVDVNVGDTVRAGQILGEMDPVDLDDRIRAQDATISRADAAVRSVEAQVRDVSARRTYAEAQARRYEELSRERLVSEEIVEARRQESQVAEAGVGAALANLGAARQELAMAHSNRDALVRQRANLLLVAPVDGLVAARDADPGTTVVAGQAVVEVIDPKTLWINARFDQLGSSELRPGLPVRIALRSQAGQEIAGRVSRMEPLADAVTEETLAKVVFDDVPERLPPVGELVEVTVALPELRAVPVVPNACVQRVDGRLGVWLIEDGDLRFTHVEVGASDLDGRVQILDGLEAGQRVVVYSQRSLEARNRVKIVDRVPGVSP